MMDGRWWLILAGFLAAVFLTSWTNAQSLIPTESPHTFKLMERKVLETILNSSIYDPNIRPPSTTSFEPDRPVLIRTNLLVRRIFEIDDRRQEWRLQITLRKSWTDPRLVYDDANGLITYVHLDKIESIWMPDIFVSNEVDLRVHDTIVPDVMIRIYPNGSVLSSFRITLRLSCNVDLRSFPHDAQVCNILLAPYKHTTKDVVMQWQDGQAPIQISQYRDPRSYVFSKFTTGYCTSRTITGEYGCLKAQFYFKRDSSSYVRRIYLPTAMFVILAWTTFWIDPAADVARLLLALGSLMASSYVVIIFDSELVVTEYVKAIDVWTGMCIAFTFASVTQFVLLHVLSRRGRQSGGGHRRRHGTAADGDSLEDSSIPMENLESSDKEPVMHQDGGRNQPSVRTTLWRRWAQAFVSSSAADRIDILFRIAYPLLFGLFVLIYWAKYASTSPIDDETLN